MKERCHLLTDFADIGTYFFTNEFSYDPKGVEKYFSGSDIAEYLKQWVEVLRGIEEFTAPVLEQGLRDLCSRLDIKPVVLIHPTRLALSGVTGGPPLFEMIELLGSSQSIERLEKAVKFILKKC
jgi:glutamyl-tRNA synthetase